MDLLVSPWMLAVVLMVGICLGIGATILCDRLVSAPDLPSAQVEGIAFHSFGGLEWPVIDGGPAPNPHGLGTEFVARNLR